MCIFPIPIDFKLCDVYPIVKHREVYVGNCTLRTIGGLAILLLLRLIRVAMIHGLAAFTTVLCGRIDLPDGPSLWSPTARAPVHPGHNPGQRKY